MYPLWIPGHGYREYRRLSCTGFLCRMHSGSTVCLFYSTSRCTSMPLFKCRPGRHERAGTGRLKWSVCVCVCVGGGVMWNFMQLVCVCVLGGGVIINFDIQIVGRGSCWHGERGRYSKMVFFLFVSCFWFTALFGLSILALEECGLSSARTCTFYSILSHNLIRSSGHHRWLHNNPFPPYPVFSCPTWAGKVHSSLLFNIVLPPLLLSASSSLSYYCALYT